MTSVLHTHSYSIAVIPVVDERTRLKQLFNRHDIEAWFKIISNYRCHIEMTVLPVLIFPNKLNTFALAGGKGPPPNNSQTLVKEILMLLDEVALNYLRQAAGRLLIVAPNTFKPHTWHIPCGGKSLGKGVWCRRYALVPYTASLGVLAHELGHLLFDWPDLIWDCLYAEECLMARGAMRNGGVDPALPCAPLLFEQGWRDVISLDRNMPVDALHFQNIGVMTWGTKKLLIEYRDDDDKPRLLLYENNRYPKIMAKIALKKYVADRSLLGIIAPYIRKLFPQVACK